MNCPFCATGQAGFARQLTPGEIVDQVLHWHRPPWHALGPIGAERRPGTYNIVFMGMGEPLNNADRVFEAVRLLNDPRAARHRRAADHGQHLGRGAGHRPHDRGAAAGEPGRSASTPPTDELRDELVPINRKWPVATVVEAGRRFAARTGRRVSLEYVMIDGVNDTLEQADGAGRRWRAAGAAT